MNTLWIPLQKPEYWLRSWVNNDAESLALNANHRDIWLNMRDEFPHPYSLEDANLFIKNANCQTNPINLAIANKQEVVGSISLRIHDDIRRYSGVISYWVGKKYWRQGIATAAITAFSNYAFENLELVRIYAKVFSTNAGSIKALENSGFQREGYFRKGIYKEGRFIDQVLYAKVM